MSSSSSSVIIPSCDYGYFTEDDFPDDLSPLRELWPPGASPPKNVHLPTGAELIKLCMSGHPRATLTYPSENPVFWIKYGTAVYWNEAVASSMAHHELARLGSHVRAPDVYYVCQYEFRIFVVMEFMSGETVKRRYKKAKSEAEKTQIRDQVALCLSEMNRIYIEPGTRPAAVDQGLIRHRMFDEAQAPRHYEDVQQLQDHLNHYLKGTKMKARLERLAEEPMVLCYSDLYPENFMIDDTGRPTIVDFADVSILPSSFAKLVLRGNRLEFDISDKVWIPTTDGVDNLLALGEAEARMPIGSYYLAKVGQKMPGGDDKTQERLRDLSTKGVKMPPIPWMKV